MTTTATRQQAGPVLFTSPQDLWVPKKLNTGISGASLIWDLQMCGKPDHVVVQAYAPGRAWPTSAVLTVGVGQDIDYPANFPEGTITIDAAEITDLLRVTAMRFLFVYVSTVCASDDMVRVIVGAA